MIPVRGHNDQNAVVLDTLAALCADKALSAAPANIDERSELREEFIDVVVTLGMPRVWELVSTVERIGWEYNVAAFHAVLFGWMSHRIKQGPKDPLCELSEAQLVLLLTMGSWSVDDTPPRDFFVHVSKVFGIVSTAATELFDTRCDFTVEQALSVAQVTYTLEQAVTNTPATAFELIYAAGIPTFLTAVVSNPDLKDYPAGWVYARLGESIREAKIQHTLTQREFLSSHARIHVDDWLNYSERTFN